MSHIGPRTRYKGQLTVLRNIDSSKTQFCFAIILLHPVAVSHKHLSDISTLEVKFLQDGFSVAGRSVPDVSRQCTDTLSHPKRTDISPKPLQRHLNSHLLYCCSPESVKTRNDVFYLLPERSCVPDSPVWYSTMALGKEPLIKMLHRVKMVKEINIALLTS